MKRAFVLCLALIVSLFAVTGSIAYFTDNIEAYNNVKAGNLHILQHEYEREKVNDRYTGALREYTQDQVIYPGVKVNGESSETITVGKYTDVVINHDNIRGFMDKIVVAENGGSLSAYVRTFVAVPAYYAGERSLQWIHLDWNKENGWKVCGEDAVIRNQAIDGVNYDIWYATNTNALAPNEVTAPSLLGYYLDSKVNHNGTHYTLDNVQLGTGSELKILVATEAAQAHEQVFEGADEAMTKTYGEPSDGRHPWAKAKSHILAQGEDLAQILNSITEYDYHIGLPDGKYTLPATLPAGIRIFAIGQNVTITGPVAISAQDVEFDSVTFTGDVSFTGWGSFEEVVFEKDCTVASVTENCNVLFSCCEFGGAYPSTGNSAIVLRDCTDLNGNALTVTADITQAE